MRILTVDIGNTAVKGSVFEEGTLLGSVVFEGRDPMALAPLVRECSPQGAVCCCVAEDATSFAGEIGKMTGTDTLVLTHGTPLPITLRYATPRTLGLDRVAAAAGAALEGGHIMVVDAGTAVTIDLVSGSVFLGGNISPGLRLRFRSLHSFTSRLPLVGPEGDIPRFGSDTATAIRAGVVRGMVAEIAAAYNDALPQCPGLRLLLTGGDAPFLLPLLAERGLSPEPAPELVGRGLESIYLYSRNATNNQQ